MYVQYTHVNATFVEANMGKFSAQPSWESTVAEAVLCGDDGDLIGNQTAR